MCPFAKDRLPIETQGVLIAVAFAWTIEVSAGVRPDLIPPQRPAIWQRLSKTRRSQSLFDIGLSGMKGHGFLEINHFLFFKQRAPCQERQQ